MPQTEPSAPGLETPAALPDLSIELARGVRLAGPLMLASGTWALDTPLARVAVEAGVVGALCTKALTARERTGNPGLRLWQSSCGWLNSVGLKNPGRDKFIATQLAQLAASGADIFVNIAGESVADYAALTEAVEQTWQASCGASAAPSGSRLLGYELNLSCPNVDHGQLFATDCALIDETVRACREWTDRLLSAKLSPNAASIVPFARAAMESGADAVTLCNTWNGVAIDVETRRSRFNRPSAGYSGPAVLPLVLYHVWQCRKALPELPIIASGGVTDADGALQCLLAGASAVQLGSGLFRNPQLPQQVHAGIADYLAAHGHGSVSEIIGAFDDSIPA